MRGSRIVPSGARAPTTRTDRGSARCQVLIKSDERRPAQIRQRLPHNLPAPPAPSLAPRPAAPLGRGQPHRELREARAVQAEGRAARRRYPSGQVIRRAPRRADDQDFGGGGTLRGSGWPGADRERDLTVERLEQCHEAINRFVVVRLVEEPIELRGRGLVPHRSRRSSRRPQAILHGAFPSFAFPTVANDEAAKDGVRARYGFRCETVR